MPQAAILARVLRGALIDTLHEDYIRTARQRARASGGVLWHHALPNAMVPVLTIVGMQFSFLLAGGVIVENVFFLPGLGRLVFQAIVQRDLIVVQSVVVILVFAVVSVTFLVDLSHAIVNPRLRAAGRRMKRAGSINVGFIVGAVITAGFVAVAVLAQFLDSL